MRIDSPQRNDTIEVLENLLKTCPQFEKDIATRISTTVHGMDFQPEGNKNNTATLEHKN